MTAEAADSSLRYFAHSEVRESQSDMIEDGIEALLTEGFLMASAPTGIGKTAAALASAISVQRSSSDEISILFLTGRQSQHRIVVDTVHDINKRLGQSEPSIRLVDLIGREGMCRNVDRISGKCDCEDELDSSIREELRGEVRSSILRTVTHVDNLIETCKKNHLCPWATARDAVKNCNILVCDYNHVFIDSVREASLPAMGIDLENTILIVDEAHNLPDRVRNGMSRKITSNIFRNAKSDVEEHIGNVRKAVVKGEEIELDEMEWAERSLKRLQSQMPTWFDARERELEGLDEDDMQIETRHLLDEMEAILNETLEEIPTGRLPSLKRLVAQLLTVRIESDEGVDDDEDERENDCERLASFIETCGQYEDSPALVLVYDKLLDRTQVRSFLLDPGVVSGPLFTTCRGSILMSGTLFPAEMYRDLLRIPKNGERQLLAKEYGSPFLSERRPVLIAQNTTSRYTERGESNTNNIRDHIIEVLRNTPGHVALFTQSYAMLDMVLGDYRWIPWGTHVEKETARMRKRLVGEMIENLYQNRRTNDRVLLCGVLSGKLAEGVDYPENILDAVICVGLPVPPPSARQKALTDYCKDKFGVNVARRYSSHQPAVNSVLQAIGRPIRKANDRALVVILEKRMRE
ncbi:MAG: ATP-dependent DNA helicase, partial [Candidatus Thermoplasmatota archaeon]|nr:ATP-dependent DNA helicase [Candidatus Thermoplasmatota archaeon]